MDKKKKENIYIQVENRFFFPKWWKESKGDKVNDTEGYWWKGEKTKDVAKQKHLNRLSFRGKYKI